MVRFAHLHTHSHFSLLEGNAQIDDLCAAAAEDGQTHLALTDHGNLFGAIEFYKAATGKGLRPILGCEATLVKDRRVRDAKEPGSHLTLLAENAQGYRNLIKIVSAGYLEGFYFRPRVDREVIQKYHEGIIALSGCMSGEVSRRLIAGDMDAAARAACEWRDVFGADRFFLEVMENQIPLQRRQREGMLALAEATGIKAVLTQDVHYIRPEDARAREVMMCIGSGKTLKDENRRRLETDQQHFRTAAEMAALFKGAELLCENAYDVATRCNVELRFDEFHLPKFQVPGGEDPLQFFRRCCDEGAKRRYGAPLTERIVKRLEYEIDVVREMGFVAYFLIVADFIQHARERGIPVGPGRGSAAGSIVAYSLGITDVDPLAYDLLFERFLNRGRISMPDIDIDFCRDRRGEVIQYVTEKYGRENVCQIVTFGTMAAKASIRDAGRVLGIDLAKIDLIAKRIPTTPGTELKSAIEQDAEMRGWIEKDADLKELFDVSLSIEGLNRHTSTHAAGVVIADQDLTEYVPLCRVQDEINTQFQMGDLESIGLLKMDFLGLKTLTVLQRAVDLIRASTGTVVDLERLPLDDRKTYELLQTGATTGVFQLESGGMRELLTKMKPDTFEDIVAILALYRPGPLGSGMVDSFVNRKHGKEPIEYPHPSLQPILEATYGVMVYQEQIMRISNVLAGFSLEEADNLRKAMGKKKPEVMEKFRTKFVGGAQKKGVDEAVATHIWEQMAYFAGYGFNKSHTVAYGILTYRTAWLKANWPQHFFAACMSIDRGDTDKVAEFLDECRKSGIEVRCPDLNASQLDFSIEDGAIRFGLGAIKGVGEKPVAAVLDARARLKRGFKSLEEVFEEVDLAAMNKSVVEKFIAAGAFDWSEQPRGRVHEGVELLIKAGQQVQADKKAGQLGLFGGGGSKKSGRVPLPDVPEWPDRERMKRERDALGFHLTDHPLRRHAATLERYCSHGLGSLPNLEHDSDVVVAGFIQGVRLTTAKKGRSAGQKMAIFKIHALDAEPVTAICFAEDYLKHQERIADDVIGLFSGAVSKAREELVLRVTGIERIEEVLERKVQSVVLTLGEDSEALLTKLKETLLRFTGHAPVYLRFQRRGMETEVVRCGPRYNVKPSEDLFDALDQLLGKGVVSCR